MAFEVLEDGRQPESKVAGCWNANAARWADLVRQGQDMYREVFNNPAFFEFIGPQKGRRVLDAGCGEGYNTRLLAAQGARMAGIDISGRMIELARRQEELEPLGISYHTASFADLSIFGDGVFDTVVSFMALMDGPLYEPAIREIARVLKPGGELYFSLTHPCFVTRQMAWQKDEAGRELCLTVGDYFREEPWLESWTFSKSAAAERQEPFEVPRFPRTLSGYLNPLLENGLMLKKIHEPRPTEEQCAQYPWLARWRKHAAIFMYIAAVKPA